MPGGPRTLRQRIGFLHFHALRLKGPRHGCDRNCALVREAVARRHVLAGRKDGQHTFVDQRVLVGEVIPGGASGGNAVLQVGQVGAWFMQLGGGWLSSNSPMGKRDRKSQRSAIPRVGNPSLVGHGQPAMPHRSCPIPGYCRHPHQRQTPGLSGGAGGFPTRS